MYVGTYIFEEQLRITKDDRIPRNDTHNQLQQEQLSCVRT